jgi:hypothetical protein
MSREQRFRRRRRDRALARLEMHRGVHVDMQSRWKTRIASPLLDACRGTQVAVTAGFIAMEGI